MDELIKFPTSIIAKEKGFKIFKDNHLGYAEHQMVFDPDGTLCWLSYDANPYRAMSWFELSKYHSSDSRDPKNKRCFAIKNSFEPVGIETYLAPTQTTLHKWLRIHHKLHVRVDNVNNPIKNRWFFEIQRLPTGIINLWNINSITFETYELAMEAGLEEALKQIPSELIGQKCSFMIDTESYNGEIVNVDNDVVSVKVFNGVINNIVISNIELK